MVFNVVDGFTVTRMRDRGIWLRPSFWVIKNARLATNRDSVSLVTAGGVDGTAPGNWALLEDSVLVGISLNNVDRFGPCPYPGLTGPESGGELGCIDQTPFNRGTVVARQRRRRHRPGLPEPKRNFFGLMIYDGPGRYFRNRFVNFNRDITPYLTAADQTALGWYKANYWNPMAPPPLNAAGSFVYEGDAALGWFNANQSSYPNTQASEGLEFENVDLRHQIYTDRVGIDKFNDGDKNTLILDRDGSLTGMKVVGPDRKPVGNVFPPRSTTCRSTPHPTPSTSACRQAHQNTLLEGRPTSLISPSSMATLEFSSLFPKAFQKEANDKKEYRYEQILAFSKTTPDKYPTPVGTLHDKMKLHGRNGLGVWEPKVSNGYGYTVSALPKYNDPIQAGPDGQDVGIPPSFNVGLTDAVLPADPATHDGKAVPCAPGHLLHRQGWQASAAEDGLQASCSRSRGGTRPTARRPPTARRWRTRNSGSRSRSATTSTPRTREISRAVRRRAGPWSKDSAPTARRRTAECCPTKPLRPRTSREAGRANENSWYYDKNSGYLYLHLLQKVDNGNRGRRRHHRPAVAIRPR